MSYDERLVLYRNIEQLRNRPLVTFVTSLRPNATGQIAPDVISEFARQILAVPQEASEIDILIVSNGGDPTVAWRIISLLRERFNIISVLLPYTAYSAATLLAMGADEIVMHPFANLGPVDPQITSTRPREGQNPEVHRFGSEDLIHYLAFVREDVGITDQAELQKAFELLCKDVGALPVGSAKRSAQLMLSLGEKLLSLHMSDRNEARTIAESLNKSFYHHGYPVGRIEAQKIKLPIAESNKELEDLLWQVWESLESEMQCNVPFNPLEHVLNSDGAATLLGPVPQVQLPVNLPPQILQQAYGQILQQAGIVQIPLIDYELLHAVVESRRCRSQFRTIGKIGAARLPDMNFSISVTPTSQKWTFSQAPDIINE